MQVYEKNKQMIAEHNRLYDLGQSTYTMGMNLYGDMVNPSVYGEFVCIKFTIFAILSNFYKVFNIVCII